MQIPKYILPIIIIAQFFCTSLWFAGNSVMYDLILNFGLPSNALGSLTSIVQFGFIIGTLIFAILSIADRYAPSTVFFYCAIFGAVFNLGIIWEGNTLSSVLILRFCTGFFLAGIYPVGMKIASDYYEKGLGKSLGYLVGALVLGTAFPHLLKGMTGRLSWEYVLIITSSLAVIGGSLMRLFVPDGPYRKPSQQLQLAAFFTVFQQRKFRAAAYGYFGHMWELYAFWAFVPIILQTYNETYPEVSFNIPLWSFCIIGIGSIACIIAGHLSQKTDTKRIASLALSLSCCCCLICPLIFAIESAFIFIMFLLIWGMVVIADSPLFSTLVAQNAPIQLKGTALTIVNCIGFSITILSIQFISVLESRIDSSFVFVILAIGPIIGLIALFDKKYN